MAARIRLICIVSLILALPIVSSEAMGQSVAVPAQFRLCSMDVDYPPYGRVDGSGHLQYLARQAAREMGMKLERSVAPRRRCFEQLRAGQVDGMIGAYSTERAKYVVFPMAAGVPDEKKAVGTPRYSLYRRKGAALDWDGKQFTGLGLGTIGVESGFTIIIEKLRQLQVRFDDGPKSLELNFAKLASGRIDGVIGMEVEADRLLANRYAGKIERAMHPFEQTPLYMMLSRQFQTQYPAATTRYWQALEDYRGTADYRQYQKTHP
ncbi:MAG: substrate-binding periplasmic protein [Sphingomonadaceae bacterium]